MKLEAEHMVVITLICIAIFVILLITGCSSDLDYINKVDQERYELAAENCNGTVVGIGPGAGHINSYECDPCWKR